LRVLTVVITLINAELAQGVPSGEEDQLTPSLRLQARALPRMRYALVGLSEAGWVELGVG